MFICNSNNHIGIKIIHKTIRFWVPTPQFVPENLKYGHFRHEIKGKLPQTFTYQIFLYSNMLNAVTYCKQTQLNLIS